jgi:hypothetical protein
VAHRAAESRAATSHQNALALQEVGLKHRILNSWPWSLSGFHVRVSATSAVELRMTSAARRDAPAFRWRAAVTTSDAGPQRSCAAAGSRSRRGCRECSGARVRLRGPDRAGVYSIAAESQRLLAPTQ